MDEKSKFLEKYVEAAVAHMDASLKGDHRAANRRYRVLKGMFGRLQADLPFARDVLVALFEHSHPAVRSWAATHALGLNENVERALAVLENVAREEQAGIVGLSAEMAMKEWRRRGRLTF